jgi:hypothetical protein
MVDQRIIPTFLHGSKVGSTGGGSRNFPAENAAAANIARFDCVFAFGESHKLVAGPGINGQAACRDTGIFNERFDDVIKP